MTDLAPAVLSRLNLRDQLLDAYPELADDEQALLDSLAGMDNFEEACAAVLREALYREAQATGVGKLIDEMHERQKRLYGGVDRLRAAVLQAMQSAGVPKLSAPDMSVSIGRGKPKVIITDAESLPRYLCRVKTTTEPDKTKIAEALKAGDVPGAALGNPQPFLQIHRR